MVPELKMYDGIKISSSRIRNLPEKFSINGLKLLDFLNLSPFAPWHYLTYHKPFYFDSSYVYDQLNYLPKGSNIEIMIESYKSYLSNLNKEHNSESSPHRTKLKSTFIDIAANLISKTNF